MSEFDPQEVREALDEGMNPIDLIEEGASPALVA
jgi:hypothetical protein